LIFRIAGVFGISYLNGFGSSDISDFIRIKTKFIERGSNFTICEPAILKRNIMCTVHLLVF